MRKLFMTLIMGIFVCLNYINSQVIVSMSSSEVEQNTTASVDVTVTNFTNLIGLQFSINYDSLILEYSSITNINTAAIRGLDIGVIGVPGQGTLKKGQITLGWNDPATTGVTVPSNTRLFTINFVAIGPKGSQSDIVTSNTPRVINVVYDNFTEDQNLTNNKGTVKIKNDGGPAPTCVDPVCTDPTFVTFQGPTLNVQKDQNICVPITVKNFTNIQSGQGTFKWDPTILQYTEAKFPTTGGLPGLTINSGVNATQVGNGIFIIVWDNPNPSTPINLPDSTVIFELCFKAIGAIGDVGCITMADAPVEFSWDKEGQTDVPLCFKYGKVTITEGGGTPPVIIKTGSTSGKKGQTVCVDVTVENFNAIVGINTTYSWNPAQLKFIRTEGYDLEGLNSSAFASTSNTLKVAWFNANPQTKPNGHKIFSICFELQCVSNSNYTAQILISGTSEVSAEVGGTPTKVNANITGGSINVNCTDSTDPEPVCTIGTIFKPSCAGSRDGRINVSVVDGNTCDFEWKNSAGTKLHGGAISAGNLSLNGIGAGTYTFNVICGGNIATTCTATVEDPTPITIPSNGVVTNASCGNGGAINITGTSGGNGGFTYAWQPDQGNTGNPTNLQAGTYNVTVTDSKNCTATASFTVGSTSQPLSVTVTPTHVKCKGDSTGEALVNVSGGCQPFTFAWTGGLSGANPKNIKAGSYSVTVTDSNSQTATASVTVNEPANALAVAVSGITHPTSPTANDGKIAISITGGTPDYSTSWSGGLQGGTTSGNQEVSNVKAGTYAVTVTDANGCVVTRNNIEVTDSTITVSPQLGNVSVTSSFNGFGIACFGDSNGVISGSVAKGSYPITVTLKSGSQTIGNPLVINGPDFSFSNLAAGTYTVEIKNASGSVTSSAITITRPTKLAATVKISCTKGNDETGSIEINMGNTGAGNYSFNWLNSSELTNKLQNIGIGVYGVTVTDANNCELRLNNLEIKECEINVGECYEASAIITPNGDNVNDLFLINCIADYPSDLVVFDRWGRLVYEQKNYDNTWQGIDNEGRDLREGGYIWVLTVNFGQGRREVYKGTVTILR